MRKKITKIMMAATLASLCLCGCQKANEKKKNNKVENVSSEEKKAGDKASEIERSPEAERLLEAVEKQ